ncbi:hypothetical protein GCM10010191_42020 [Actinomadura vinacea]|uniref:Luciferase-like domain-containing protein n=1 Tax=Actinomadura vinacea TaxID=115336 RepID=A0ABN3JAY0_9ACTN
MTQSSVAPFRSGFDVALVPDHLGAPAPFPTMVAAADATERLRVGTLVLNNEFWKPHLLAREVASADRLSGGRLELGLGGATRSRGSRPAPTGSGPRSRPPSRWSSSGSTRATASPGWSSTCSCRWCRSPATAGPPPRSWPPAPCPLPYLSVEQVLECPVVLIGTEDEIAGQLRERRERYGFSYITVHSPFMEAFGPVIERLR